MKTAMLWVFLDFFFFHNHDLLTSTSPFLFYFFKTQTVRETVPITVPIHSTDITYFFDN